MRTMVVAVVVAAAMSGCSAARDAPAPGPSSSPDAEPGGSTRPPASFGGLAIGEPPALAYVRAGRTVVLGDRSVELHRRVSALTAGSSVVWLYAPREHTVSLVLGRRVVVVSSRATSPAYAVGIPYWIEDDHRIMYNADKPADPQPLPDGCCHDAVVIGADLDMDPDVFVRADGKVWMWDTYEGREGSEHPPPDTDRYFWPVAGTGSGELVGTGISSEVLVSYPGHEWGWGYVAGPRVPGSSTPVDYREREHLSAERVWLTSPGIVALEADGRLVELGASLRSDQEGHGWRGLTGGRSRLRLPDGLTVAGVVGEDRHDVLVDATDRSGARAWVRCHLPTHACEVAAELGPDDVVPLR